MADPCTTPNCPGDATFASPGHGHAPECTYPVPYDGRPLANLEALASNLGPAAAPYLTVVLLFGAAAQGANRNEKKALYEARLLLSRDKAPLATVAQAIMDARGPEWSPPSDVLAAINALYKETP